MWVWLVWGWLRLALLLSSSSCSKMSISVFQQPPGRLNSQHQGLLGVSPPTKCGLVIRSQPITVLLDLLVPSPLRGLGEFSHYYSVSYYVRYHRWLGSNFYQHIDCKWAYYVEQESWGLEGWMLLRPDPSAAVTPGQPPVLYEALMWSRHPELLSEGTCSILFHLFWLGINHLNLLWKLIWAWCSCYIYFSLDRWK